MADTGLVAHWTLDDGSGSTITDSSGNSNNMNIAGTPTWVSGKIGSGAISFDGATNYAHISASTFNNTPASTMTLCSWIKTSPSNTDQDIIGFSRNQNSNYNEGIFKVLSTGALQFWDYGTTNYGFPYSGSGSSKVVADGHWHLGCFVKNGTSGTYYVDGLPSGTVTASQDITYGNYDW